MRFGAQNRSNKKTAKKFTLIVLAFICISQLFSIVHQSGVISERRQEEDGTGGENGLSDRAMEEKIGKLSALKCTDSQLRIIEEHLPPTRCKGLPFVQRCSFTKATKCPDASWIDNHYQRALTLLPKETTTASETTFVGMYVGCNKGFDAINTMRMGSRDPTFDKNHWRKALGDDVDEAVCGQSLTPQFPLPDPSAQPYPIRSAETHCIEPMPLTINALNQAATKLRLKERGFVVTKAALASSSGTARFPSAPLGVEDHEKVKVGTENKGISSCQEALDDENCEDVPMLTLDSYANQFVKSKGPIHFLSIDVEGYDFDVLLGGEETLKRTQYLEFEYNWMGSWAKQNLIDAITLLDTYDFTCYWAGEQKLWQITNCWLDHYSYRNWSNVACVRRSATILSKSMEELFLKTIGEL